MTEKEINLMAYRHEKTPWLPARVSGQDICANPSAVLDAPKEHGRFVSWFGIPFDYPEGQPGPMPEYDNPLIKDIEDWESCITWPDLDGIDWEACAHRDTAGWDRENRMSGIYLQYGMFETFQLFCGMENALCFLLTDPDSVRDLLCALAKFRIRLIERIHKYYKPDKLVLHDDYGMNQNLLMPPDTWRDVIKPNLKMIVDAVHDMGMFYEHHSCGYIVPLMDDFVELGIDALNPIQQQNNPLEVLKRWGDKITLVGCFDGQNVLNQPGLSEKEFRAYLIQTLETMCAPGIPWVAAPSMLDINRYPIWYEVLEEWNRKNYPAFRTQSSPFRCVVN